MLAKHLDMKFVLDIFKTNLIYLNQNQIGKIIFSSYVCNVKIFSYPLDFNVYDIKSN